MQRFDIINALIGRHGHKRYLEIGVLGNEAFNAINVEDKTSVDPNGQGTHTMTSDAFFDQLEKMERFDIIFIDGMHLAEFTQRDIENSLQHLAPGGSIVVHDCLPKEEYQQLRDMISGRPWTGDVWKAWAFFRANRPGLEMSVVDTDWGCGVIRRGEQDCIAIPDELTWEYFVANRDTLMGVITVEEFNETT